MLVGVLLLVGLGTYHIRAQQDASRFTLSIELDGEDYGEVYEVQALHQKLMETHDSGPAVLTIKRDTVTDRLLSGWAEQSRDNKTFVENVELVKRDRFGNELGRFELDSCRPVSWSLKSLENSQHGAYQEVVKLSVENILYDASL